LLLENVVAAFVDDYRKTRRSADQVAATLRRYALTAWPGRRIDEIAADDIRRLLAGVARTKPIMANRLWAAISVLFKWARRQAVISTLPTFDIERPVEREHSRDRALSDEELRDVWQAADRIGYPFGRLVQILVLTGLRRGEVAGASRHEMDLGRREWIIPRQRAKNNVDHLVPLTDQITALLERLPVIDRGHLLFPAARGTRSISGFGKLKARLDGVINELRTERGEGPMPSWSLHDLRRTITAGLQRQGFPLEITERVLGHQRGGSLKGIARVYAVHDYGAEKRRAIESWGQHVAGLIAPTPPTVVELRRPHHASTI
jgi:integrase